LLRTAYTDASTRKCFQSGVRDWLVARGTQSVFTGFNAFEGTLDFLHCAAFSLEGYSRHILDAAIALLEDTHVESIDLAQDISRYKSTESLVDIIQCATNQQRHFSSPRLEQESLPVDTWRSLKNGDCVRYPAHRGDDVPCGAMCANMKQLICRIEYSDRLRLERYFFGSGPEIGVRIRFDAKRQHMPMQVEVMSRRVPEVQGAPPFTADRLIR